MSGEFMYTPMRFAVSCILIDTKKDNFLRWAVYTNRMKLVEDYVVHGKHAPRIISKRGVTMTCFKAT